MCKKYQLLIIAVAMLLDSLNSDFLNNESDLKKNRNWISLWLIFVSLERVFWVVGTVTVFKVDANKLVILY